MLLAYQHRFQFVIIITIGPSASILSTLTFSSILALMIGETNTFVASISSSVTRAKAILMESTPILGIHIIATKATKPITKA